MNIATCLCWISKFESLGPHTCCAVLSRYLFEANLIEAVGRGEREPLVPTEDEVAEPRNRRAELLVR